jgi:hypothetical protein
MPVGRAVSRAGLGPCESLFAAREVVAQSIDLGCRSARYPRRRVIAGASSVRYSATDKRKVPRPAHLPAGQATGISCRRAASQHVADKLRQIVLRRPSAGCETRKPRVSASSAEPEIVAEAKRDARSVSARTRRIRGENDADRWGSIRVSNFEETRLTYPDKKNDDCRTADLPSCRQSRRGLRAPSLRRPAGGW